VPLFAAGDVVITPDGVGEVEAVMTQRDRHGLWVWGAFRFDRGPYLVRLTRGALAGYAADDLSYHRVAWPMRVDPGNLEDLIGE
jgi:hypothetical protein